MLLTEIYKKYNKLYFGILKVLLVAINIYLLLPFIKISFFNVPQADDFCSNSVLWGNYWGQVFSWYQNVNGRYFNALLSSLPFWYTIQFYKLLFFLFSGFFIYVLELFLKLFTQSLILYNRIILSFTLYIIFLIFTPQISSSFYWFSGLTTYLFPFTIFILFIVTMVKFVTKNRRRNGYKLYISCLLLIFVAIGSHEVTMSFVVISSIINFIYCFKTNKNLSSSIFLMIFSFVCSSLVIFSPGTANRRLNYSDSIVNTNIFVETFIDVFNYLKFSLNTEFIIISILLIINFSTLLNQDKLRIRLNPIPTFLMLLASIIIVVFVFNYSTGTFNPLIRNRYSNILFYYSSLTWFIFLISITQKLNSIGLKTILLKNRIPIYFISSVLFFIIISNSFNYKNANWLLKNETIQDYNKEWNARKDFVQIYHKDMDTLFVPGYNNFPAMLYFDDLTHNGEYWKNSCYSENYSPNTVIIRNDESFFNFMLKNYKLTPTIINDSLEFLVLKSQFSNKLELPIVGDNLFLHYSGAKNKNFNVEILQNQRNLTSSKQTIKNITFDCDTINVKRLSFIPNPENVNIRIVEVSNNNSIEIFLSTF